MCVQITVKLRIPSLRVAIMKTYRKRLLMLALAALFSAPLQADLEAGLAAYAQGNYAEAFKQYQLAADAGDSDAFGKLAGMYLYGVGTEKDYINAYIWFGLAQHGGDKYAEKFKLAASSAMSLEQVKQAEETLAVYKKRLGK
jgi:TPR repeat protein